MNANVYIQAAGSRGGNARSVVTDDTGAFVFSDLEPGSYSISASATGYVSMERIVLGPRRQVRTGEFAEITMARGAAITGKVVDDAGEPLVALLVMAIRVRDSEGRSVAPAPESAEFYTDDRGVFRIYGLPPGTFKIRAGGLNREFTSPYRVMTPSYHAAATTLGDAADIVVRRGEEVSGIDIRFSRKPGQSVTGFVTVYDGVDPRYVAVTLVDSNSKLRYQPDSRPFTGERPEFSFSGVADGDYELSARYSKDPDDTAASPVRRVRVAGAAVKGIVLTLSPLARVGGRVILEQNQPGPNCNQDSRRGSRFIGVNLERNRMQREEESDSSRHRTTINPSSGTEFVLRNLPAGRYRIGVNVHNDDDLYVRAIGVAGPVSAARPQSSRMSDVTRDGLALSPGQRLDGLTVVLASGAAALRGKVVSKQETTSSSLGLHLVPADRERRKDPLRYIETPVRPDGAFNVTGIRPGKYWVVVRPRLVQESNAPVESIPPAGSTAQGREQLQHEAKAGKLLIELGPCQRMTSYTIDLSKPGETGPR
jgi:hypothetical protein